LNELNIEIRLTQEAAGLAVLPEELALLEAILPDILHAMIEAEAAAEVE
jgi:hypothetical protein